LADPSEDDPTMIAPLLGFAKQGTAEGKLLYVNYGRSEDFQVLKENFTITNCSGYIVIMRYGKIYPGDKVSNSTEHPKSKLDFKYKLDYDQQHHHPLFNIFKNIYSGLSYRYLHNTGITRRPANH
jgi:hypothetical protein